MTQTLRGGRPFTMRLTIPERGGHFVLPMTSVWLRFRPISGEMRVYWYEADYFGDPTGTSDTADGYMLLNGDANAGAESFPAVVSELWIRGGGAELELTVIGANT